MEIININRIIGSVLKCGRVIVHAGDYPNKAFARNEYYEFRINKINRGYEQDSFQTIVLHRITGNRYNPNDPNSIGKYEMFNMGLQNKTAVYLSIYDIKSMSTIIDYLDKIMHETYIFYKNN